MASRFDNRLIFLIFLSQLLLLFGSQGLEISPGGRTNLDDDNEYYYDDDESQSKAEEEREHDEISQTADESCIDDEENEDPVGYLQQDLPDYLRNNRRTGSRCSIKTYGLPCRYARRCGQFKYNHLISYNNRNRTYPTRIGQSRSSELNNSSYSSDALGRQDDKANSSSGYIIRGAQSTLGLWPMSVMINITSKGESVRHCSGTLVTAWHVLTAAHCFDDKEPTDLILAFGPHIVSRNGQRWGELVERRGAKFCRHKGNLDIGIVLLNEKLDLDDYIQPACLMHPYIPEPDSFSREANCYTVGYGLRERDVLTSGPHIFPDYMRPVATSCEEIDYSFFGHRNIRCFNSFDTNTSMCSGDSGSPMVCRSKDEPARWIIVGIVTSTRLICNLPFHIVPIENNFIKLTATECKPPIDDNEPDTLESMGKCEFNRDVPVCDYYEYCGRGYVNDYMTYFVSVRIIIENKVRRVCGGALIAENTVITSSDCFIERGSVLKIDRNSIFVRPGAYSLDQLSGSSALMKTRKVARLCLNRQYTLDLALKRRFLARLTLDKSVPVIKSNDGVGLELPCWPYASRGEIKMSGSQSLCMAVGLVAGKPNIAAQVAVSLTSCKNVTLESEARMACWSKRNDDGTSPLLRGQEGGPVFCRDQRGRYTLVAVVIEAEQPAAKGFVIYTAMIDPVNDLSSINYRCA